jgi:hypothetical protein
VEVFNRFEEFPSSGRSKSGSPGCVFGVVVTAGSETLPKRVIVVSSCFYVTIGLGGK